MIIDWTEECFTFKPVWPRVFGSAERQIRTEIPFLNSSWIICRCDSVRCFNMYYKPRDYQFHRGQIHTAVTAAWFIRLMNRSTSFTFCSDYGQFSNPWHRLKNVCMCRGDCNRLRARPCLNIHEFGMIMIKIMIVVMWMKFFFFFGFPQLLKTSHDQNSKI